MSEVHAKVQDALALAACGRLTTDKATEVLADVQQYLILQEEVPLHRALTALSYSEREAMKALAPQIAAEGVTKLVTSRVADGVGVTRSVIVNAIRKLEAAGLVDSQSAGMGGTVIKPKKAALWSLFIERLQAA